MAKDLSMQYLRAIIEYGNISTAARALYISQPYLSKFIKKLEEDMGVDLINRDESPLTLTYAGERYLEHMKKIEDIYLELENEIEAITNMRKGRLKLGINPILAKHTLYKILPEYIKSYPGIEIELTEGSTKEIELQLLQRKIDICVLMLPIYNSEISYENLYDDRLILVIPQGHKHYNTDLKEITPIPFDMHELDGEEFILLSPELGLRRVTDQLFLKHSIKPKIVLETFNVENAFTLARTGIGLSIIPEIIIPPSEDIEPTLYSFGNPGIKHNVAIAYKKGEALSPPAQAFLNMAKQIYKENN